LFWPLLYEAGLLPEPLMYIEDYRILEFGVGLTALVKRPTRRLFQWQRGVCAVYLSPGDFGAARRDHRASTGVCGTLH